MSYQPSQSPSAKTKQAPRNSITNLVEFRLGEVSIVVERPPWHVERLEAPRRRGRGWNWSKPISLSAVVNDRSYLPALHACFGHEWAIYTRLSAWGVIKMAESGMVSDQLLFTSSGPGESYSLIPHPRSRVPLQWAHFGPGSIPDEVANVPCDQLSTEKLLHMLNAISGTRYTLRRDGLRACLEHFLRTSRDFGQVYASLRAHWRSHFTTVLALISSRRDRLEQDRKEAMARGSKYISGADVHPRRVWDLLSNRVVTLDLVSPDPYDGRGSALPQDICTASHSWVHPDERIQIYTPINGHEWPVPLPKNTSLAHIRVELLNLNFEYVWLDVLCLRQQGQPRNEDLRKEEWKLDVPTIGAIYTGLRGALIPCVTYFNGLGLPFDPSRSTLSSDRHWLKRVWTLQEGTSSWLPGGATGLASDDAQRFFRTRALPALNRRLSDALDLTALFLKGRASTLELDKVHGLAYLFDCRTLPVYEEDTSPDIAWARLMKHISPISRFELAVQHVMQSPDDTSLLPSWDSFSKWCAVDADILSISREFGCFGDLQLLDRGPESLDTADHVAYCHRLSEDPDFQYGPIVTLGPVRITRRQQQNNRAGEMVTLVSPSGRHPPIRIRGLVGGVLSQQKPYMVILLKDRVWIVAEAVGNGRMDGKEELMVRKQGTLLLLEDMDASPEEPGRYGVLAHVQTMSIIYSADDTTGQRRPMHLPPAISGKKSEPHSSNVSRRQSSATKQPPGEARLTGRQGPPSRAQAGPGRSSKTSNSRQAPRPPSTLAQDNSPTARPQAPAKSEQHQKQAGSSRQTAQGASQRTPYLTSSRRDASQVEHPQQGKKHRVRQQVGK